MIHVRFSCNAANLIVEAGLLDLADEDVISLAGDLNTLLGHVAENADGDTGTGEGVAVDKRFVDAELATDVLHCLVKGFNLILRAVTYPHFILEQKSEGLNKLQDTVSVVS